MAASPSEQSLEDIVTEIVEGLGLERGESGQFRTLDALHALLKKVKHLEEEVAKMEGIESDIENLKMAVEELQGIINP